MEFKNVVTISCRLRTPKLDLDRCDKWNETFLAPAIFVLSVLCTASQYVGRSRLSCAGPLNIPGTYMRFVDYNCWLKGTYLYPNEMSLHGTSDYQPELITFYPLIPIILIISALIILVPSLIYRSQTKRGGMNINAIIKSSIEVEALLLNQPTLTLEKSNFIKQKYYESLAQNMQMYKKKSIMKAQNGGKYFQYIRKLRPFARSYSYDTRLYILKKFLMVLAPIIAIQIIHSFTSHFWTIGFDFAQRMHKRIISSNVESYQTSPSFPLFVLCDAEIASLNVIKTVTKYTFECVLPNNVFNDLFFTALFYILIATAIGSLINFLSWVYVIYNRTSRKNFIKQAFRIENHLSSFKNITNEEREIKRNEILKTIDGLMSIITPDMYLCMLFIYDKCIFKSEAINLLLSKLWITRSLGQPNQVVIKPTTKIQDKKLLYNAKNSLLILSSDENSSSITKMTSSEDFLSFDTKN